MFPLVGTVRSNPATAGTATDGTGAAVSRTGVGGPGVVGTDARSAGSRHGNVPDVPGRRDLEGEAVDGRGHV